MTAFTVRDGISRVGTEYGDVILDETNGRYWHVNPTAALVLDTVEHGGDGEKAAERLVSRFGIDHGTARTDAEKILSRLVELGVLK
ncbi:lasso peptide biosynthesis PqqD family chaperone [Streptomyces caeruleatus]|uniref:Lasso peptide biosynthesis PqqD family chaperone n=1 Tax=Streptomyces caeruleatus TaxID=661399 RepID=A0A101TG26_9ACTN|nr:lasso peptide biosynthesis PqqD family chaperone [Streptomyces caeruleatus]KUN91688.1 hypothetical protein AQJ67_42105 [Streptomyces caeruleatus]